MRTLLPLAAVALVNAGCPSPPGPEIGALEQKIAKLEARIAALETAAKTPAAGAAEPTGTSTPTAVAAAAELPDWAEKSARRDGGALYAVGTAPGIRNVALARATADNRARAELARLLGEHLAKIARAAGSAKKPVDVGPQLGVLQAATLDGVEIVDHWVKKDGTVYALARLDLSKLGAAIDGARSVSPKAKQALKAAAEKAAKE